MPTVSIIIPTYNRPRELAEALEALTRQHYQD
ncbi:MAG TPA: glycosyltransferase family 2 protein, partial [Exiguobacterium sp.]|nr:glycosyltransferase family 2 protein [Exiguobacterium sp.]